MSPNDESSTFTGSVTRDICNLKLGDDSAARHLCERYLQRLVSLARGKIKATRRRDPIEDEEDAALSALNSLCLRAADGRFPQLKDRDDLWRLLIVITMRKVSDQTERANAQMRARDRAVGDTALGVVPGDEPPPEVVVGLIDAYDRLRAALRDDLARRILDLRLEGYARKEISARLKCAEKTVTRKVKLIGDAARKLDLSTETVL